MAIPVWVRRSVGILLAVMFVQQCVTWRKKVSTSLSIWTEQTEHLEKLQLQIGEVLNLGTTLAEWKHHADQHEKELEVIESIKNGVTSLEARVSHVEDLLGKQRAGQASVERSDAATIASALAEASSVQSREGAKEDPIRLAKFKETKDDGPVKKGKTNKLKTVDFVDDHHFRGSGSYTPASFGAYTASRLNPTAGYAVRTVHYVVALCIEDLYWLSHFVARSGMKDLDYKIMIYVNDDRARSDVGLIDFGCMKTSEVKCPSDVAANCIVKSSKKSLQHDVNKEPSAYISYMLDYKGKYADIVIFTHGNPYVHSCTVEDDVHYYLRYPPESGFGNLNWEVWGTSCDAKIAPFHPVLPFKCCAGSNQQNCRRTVSTWCCIQFIATSDKIASLDLPRIEKSIEAAHKGGVKNIGVVMESMWQSLMNISMGEAMWEWAPPSLYALPFDKPNTFSKLEIEVLKSCLVFPRNPARWRKGSIPFRTNFHRRVLDQISPFAISKEDKVYYLNSSYFPLTAPAYKGTIRHAKRPMPELIDGIWAAMDKYGRTYYRLLEGVQS